jgi:DUF4097 and DUF4098 domain-containing protein YvlB
MPQGRLLRHGLSTLVLIMATAGLAACDVAFSAFDGGHARATDQWTRSYTLSDGATIEVKNTNGRIQVEGIDGKTCEVRAELTARAGTEEAARDILKQTTIREDVSDTHVRLVTDYPKGLRRSGVDVVYVLRVPRGVRLEVETVNGGIEVTNVNGAVRAETTNGGVKARALSGGVVATATNGGIDVEVSAITDAGVRLETTNGGVELRLPDTAKGSISARCVNGGITVTDLTIESTKTSRRHLEGTLNGGGPSIQLETVNGGIRLRR